MKLKELLEIIDAGTFVYFSFKVNGVWLKDNVAETKAAFNKYEKFYEFKVTKIAIDSMPLFGNSISVYAEEC